MLNTNISSNILATIHTNKQYTTNTSTNTTIAIFIIYITDYNYISYRK